MCIRDSSLTAQPLATVTVDAEFGEDDIATISPSARTYTTSNWNTNQNFTVSGVEDDDLANETVQLTFSSSGGGYDGIDRVVPVTVIDQDTAGLVIVAVDGTTVGEGDSIEFTVKLSNEPSDDVEVTVSTDNDDVILVGTDEDDIDDDSVTLTFTSENWDTNQSVYVEGVQDSDADDETGFIDFSAEGGGFNLDIVQQVHVTDDDKSLLVSKTIPTLSEGATNTYQVRLNAAPSGNVTVTSMSGNTDALAVTPTTRTFTPDNWSTPQTFTATAQQDANAIDETIEVTFTASGADFNNLSVETDTEVTDDETVGFQITGSQTIVEGAGGLLRLRLTSEPSANVSVAATSSNTAVFTVTATDTPRTYTPDNWNTYQVFRFYGIPDTDEETETATMDFAATGGDYGDVEASQTITVRDVDASAVLSNFSTSIAEGGSDVYNVRLSRQPQTNVTVKTASSDTTALTVSSGASLTFTTVNWNVVQSVVLTAPQDADAVSETVTITTTGVGAIPTNVDFAEHTRTVTITDDETASIVITNLQSGYTEGSTVNLSVRLSSQPAGGNVVVTASSDDTGAVNFLTTSRTYTPSNYTSVQNFVMSFPQDSDSDNEMVDITLSASGGGYDDVETEATVNVLDDEGVNLVFSSAPTTVDEGGSAIFSLQLNQSPHANSTVTVAASSNKTGKLTVNPASRTFTPDNWDTDQDFTVFGVEDADTVDETVIVSFAVSGGGFGGADTTRTITVTDDDTADYVVPCLLYTSPSPRDRTRSRMPSSA